MFLVLAVILGPFAAGFALAHSPSAGPNLIPLLTSLILLPILSAFVVMASPEKYARWIVLFTASCVLGISFKIFFLYQNSLAGFQLIEDVPWLGNLGIHYLLGVDGMSTLMVVLTACVYFAGALVSWNISLRRKEYFVLFMSSRFCRCTSWWVSGEAGAKNTRP
jgi:NADH:ubiquinone oxidoreductase subunit 4 (subunit M)